MRVPRMSPGMVSGEVEAFAFFLIARPGSLLPLNETFYLATYVFVFLHLHHGGENLFPGSGVALHFIRSAFPQLRSCERCGWRTDD